MTCLLERVPTLENYCPINAVASVVCTAVQDAEHACMPLSPSSPPKAGFQAFFVLLLQTRFGRMMRMTLPLKTRPMTR